MSIQFICSYIAYKRSTFVLSTFYTLRKQIINIYIKLYICNICISNRFEKNMNYLQYEMAMRVFASDFILGEMIISNLVSCQSLVSVHMKYSEMKCIAGGSHFDRNQISFLVMKQYVNTISKSNRTKENIYALYFLIKANILDQKIKMSFSFACNEN